MSSDRESTAWILAQRPPRASINPARPHAWFLEQEPSDSGRIIDSFCILLAGKECPWRCLMCDLWKHTLTYPTPSGAIPRQIDFALAQVQSRPEQVKLYNSGSFFDTAAVPPEDYRAIAERVSFAKKVVVECHPRLVGERTLRFRDLLCGSLEVALGLETAQPEVLARLNKRFNLEDYKRAAGFLRRNGIAVRAFVLVQPPFTAHEDAVHWAVQSSEFAFRWGASVVSLIPTRSGNGAMEQLINTGEFRPPTIRTLEQAVEAALRLKTGKIFADLWDIEKFATCRACLVERKRRLEFANLRQELQPPIICSECSPLPPRHP